MLVVNIFSKTFNIFIPIPNDFTSGMDSFAPDSLAVLSTLDVIVFESASIPSLYVWFDKQYCLWSLVLGEVDEEEEMKNVRVMGKDEGRECIKCRRAWSCSSSLWMMMMTIRLAGRMP